MFRKLLNFRRKQRIGPELCPETKRRIEILFNPQNQSWVSELLTSRCGYGIPGFKNASESDFERLHFAVLKMSDGNVGKLLQAVELAELDFRDLLLSTGFAELTTHQTWLPERKWTE